MLQWVCHMLNCYMVVVHWCNSLVFGGFGWSFCFVFDLLVCLPFGLLVYLVCGWFVTGFPMFV